MSGKKRPVGVRSIQRDFDKKGKPYPNWLRERQSEIAKKKKQ